MLWSKQCPGENVLVKQEWNAIKKLHVFYKTVFLKGHGNDVGQIEFCNASGMYF